MDSSESPLSRVSSNYSFNFHLLVGINNFLYTYNNIIPVYNIDQINPDYWVRRANKRLIINSFLINYYFHYGAEKFVSFKYKNVYTDDDEVNFSKMVGHQYMITLFDRINISTKNFKYLMH